MSLKASLSFLRWDRWACVLKVSTGQCLFHHGLRPCCNPYASSSLWTQDEEILHSDDSATSISGEKDPAVVLMLVDKAPGDPGNLLLSLLLLSSSLEATHNNPSDTKLSHTADSRQGRCVSKMEEIKEIKREQRARIHFWKGRSPSNFFCHASKHSATLGASNNTLNPGLKSSYWITFRAKRINSQSTAVLWAPKTGYCFLISFLWK